MKDIEDLKREGEERFPGYVFQVLDSNLVRVYPRTGIGSIHTRGCTDVTLHRAIGFAEGFLAGSGRLLRTAGKQEAIWTFRYFSPF